MHVSEIKCLCLHLVGKVSFQNTLPAFDFKPTCLVNDHLLILMLTHIAVQVTETRGQTLDRLLSTLNRQSELQWDNSLINEVTIWILQKLDYQILQGAIPDVTADDADICMDTFLGLFPAGRSSREIAYLANKRQRMK